ncbi:MAG: MFS transporter [Chloroflexi bacterium]|nr:MFS transporter [Chloroflexota bacterium]
MSRNRLIVITLGVMLSLFLASMEGTVVATAMPTIVAQLGGLSIYSWVFSIYMLTSTTTVPIYGKLSDLYGRKRVYLVSMVMFLAGSVLCAQAQNMDQLVFFRALQGLGAGGVLPLVFTIIGELFTLEQRSRMQGLFSGVWGVSSVIGPLIGGFLVDQVSWHWVFLINVFPGVTALLLVWFAWRDSGPVKKANVAIDSLGALFLTLGVLSLLLGLNELCTVLGWVFIVLGCALLGALVWAERRAADPILPLKLFRERLFTISIVHGVLAGWAMFGSLSYVPLFVQAVLGTSATQAGISLTPMSLFWTLASLIGGPLLLKMGYRTLALGGMVLLVAGTLLMSRIGLNASEIEIMVYTGLMGAGMGLCIPAFLIAVQSTVRREELGVATSTVQFSRSIGGTIGVSVMGVFLSTRLASYLLAHGVDPLTVSLETLLDPVASASARIEGPLREALAISIANLFVIAFAAAAIGLLAVLLAPGGKISQLMDNRR